MSLRRNGIYALLLLALAGCGDAGYDAPEEAEPFDTIAPGPVETVVPGADEPGPDENRPGL
jgi:hypothetical protein